MHLIGTFFAANPPRHSGDYNLFLESQDKQFNHIIYGDEVPRGTPLREAAQEWCDSNGHTLKIDWTTLTQDKP